MTSIRPIPSGFQKGEAVVLARGTYPGTHGVFLSLRDDPAWADIQESGGATNKHPVAWLEHDAARTAGR
jgi:hypothetical protein